MTSRADQEMIDYFSSNEHVLDRIAKAIRADDDFEAAKLILIFQNRAGATDAGIAAWMLGPVEGQALISDFIEEHGIALEEKKP